MKNISFELKDIKKRYGRNYLVSTVKLHFDYFIEDYVYETMIFPCDEGGKTNYKHEVYGDRYFTEEEARFGHKDILDNFTELTFNIYEVEED